MRPAFIAILSILLLTGCTTADPGEGDERACPDLDLAVEPREIRAGERLGIGFSIAACEESVALPTGGCGLLVVAPAGSATLRFLARDGHAHAGAPAEECADVPAAIAPDSSWNATWSWDGLVQDAAGGLRPASPGEYRVELRAGGASASTSVTVLPPPVQRIVQANDSFRTIARGAVTPLHHAEHVVVSDSRAWRELWSAHAADDFPPPDMPEIDFARERILAAFAGPKPGECWGIEVVDVRTDESAGVTNVSLVLHEPRPGAACADLETRPYHFVALAKLPTRLAFETSSVADGEP